ncbi:hypothetical protein IFR05_017330 [Cadophora sp. M221]|nr:hypothetical protein IFR05_017330 [Cadophora sp. M221]
MFIPYQRQSSKSSMYQNLKITAGNAHNKDYREFSFKYVDLCQILFRPKDPLPPASADFIANIDQSPDSEESSPQAELDNQLRETLKQSADHEESSPQAELDNQLRETLKQSANHEESSPQAELDNQLRETLKQSADREERSPQAELDELTTPKLTRMGQQYQDQEAQRQTDSPEELAQPQIRAERAGSQNAQRELARTEQLQLEEIEGIMVKYEEKLRLYDILKREEGLKVKAKRITQREEELRSMQQAIEVSKHQLKHEDAEAHWREKERDVIIKLVEIKSKRRDFDRSIEIANVKGRALEEKEAELLDWE